MVKRYFVPTRMLQRGMKIDQSIVDGTNRVLIARGAILEDFMIKGLLKLGISGVYIREGEEETNNRYVIGYTSSKTPRIFGGENQNIFSPVCVPYQEYANCRKQNIKNQHIRD